jgi:hypothetical protein
MRTKRWRTIGVTGSVLAIVSLLAAATAFSDPVAPAAVAAPAAPASKGMAALDAAAKAHKYLFVFFYAGQDTHTGDMNGVFQAAMARLTDRADSIAVSLADPAEKPLVDKYGVSRAPMPFVLAIAPNGAATHGFPTQWDENQLQQAFVSPCTAKCMKVIQERRMILLCVQNGRTQSNAAAMQGVNEFKADPQYAAGTEVVALNPADQAEAGFLQALQVDPQTTTAVTLLVTPPGSPVARFVGAVTKDEIIAKIKAAQAGCGPGCSCHH